MPPLQLQPSHKAVRAYYESLRQLSILHVSHEGAVRAAFQRLLEECARRFGLSLVLEWELKRQQQRSLRVDGALIDDFRLVHGYWEAKDSHDDLAKETRAKLATGYPKDNILFQAPERLILIQNGRQVLDEDIRRPEALVEALRLFFGYLPPAYEQWGQAVGEFQTKIPELAEALLRLIEKERKDNGRFVEAFDRFSLICRQSINPDLSVKAVEEMLVQHLLTERIFRTVFNNSDFTHRNVVAREIERVIDALTSQTFSRQSFMKGLERFYGAIERTAMTIESFADKQGFLNTVYEKFFQGFSGQTADALGIVYTPPSVVRFMISSVEEILRRDFGRSLSDRGVHILDPFVGTGNFLVHAMQHIKKTALPHKYEHEFFANEVMLLPYYIASMNIEHQYFEATGTYKPFQGLCLVDTFELAEERQLSLFTAENTERVARQRRAPIFVVMGNPPYNANQVNENDNNKNRKYPTMDRRVQETYVKESNARLRTRYGDPYIKALRWATDRIGQDGIVAFVTNSSFVHKNSLDGVRAGLGSDFDEIYILDLGGSVKDNPKLSGTTHNVFGIMPGVSINILVRKRGDKSKRAAVQRRVFYAATGELWRKEERYRFLDSAESIRGVEWQTLEPDERHTWLREGLEARFDSFLPLGVRERDGDDSHSIFGAFSLGVSTNRDWVVYDFDEAALLARVEQFCEDYNEEVKRYHKKGKGKSVDEFVDYSKIKWSRNLKRALAETDLLLFKKGHVRTAIYRPYTKRALYFTETIIDEPGRHASFFPSGAENRAIGVSDKGCRAPFSALAVDTLPDLHLCASADGFQFFPFYTYDDDGERRENITEWALDRFRGHYRDKSICKWDIFYYIYAVLHHAGYRKRYEVNLQKRGLPRIPLVAGKKAFQSLAALGQQLADLHIGYERQPEHPLEQIETPSQQLNYRVEQMRLAKDRRSLRYNDFLTLGGIPPEVFEYRLGGRSALEWLIDQYRVKTDPRSGIRSDPNLAADPSYMLRLIGQVITVSLETVKLVRQVAEVSLE